MNRDQTQMEKDRVERFLPTGAPLTIAIVTFLTYAATLSFDFVFDDHVLIVSNDSIRSWHYFPTYFTSHIWSFRYPHLLANHYRPLFLIWLRMNDVLFGLHPWGWHLTSVLAHVAVTYLVYRLCLRLTGSGWLAGAAGLIFGLHPVHAEAVADITSIQEPLATLLILGAMLSFICSRENRPRRGSRAASLALTAAALLSKESAMMMPIFVALYAWIYPEPDSGEFSIIMRMRATLVAAAPFLAVTLLYVPLRVWALKGFAHTVTQVDSRTEILTIPAVLIFYLRLLIWPVGLSCYYDTPYTTAATLHRFFLPLVEILAVASLLVVWYLRTRRTSLVDARILAFGGLWIAFAILPVLNFRLLPEGELAHDRYLYLPSVGFCLLVALALHHGFRAERQFHVRPAWVVAAGALACLLMAVATARESLYWSDDFSLDYRAHQIAPHNVSATTSLAAALAQRGMAGPAAELYQEALAIQPGFWRANVNLAYLYYAEGDYQASARYFARACAADPTDGDQFLYLGMAMLRMGQVAEAEKAVRTALLVRPNGKNYHLGLAMVLKAEGKLAEAQHELQLSLEQDSGNVQARELSEEVTREMQVGNQKVP